MIPFPNVSILFIMGTMGVRIALIVGLAREAGVIVGLSGKYILSGGEVDAVI